MRARTGLVLGALLAASTVARPAEAFLFPEHARITQMALERLATDRELGPLVHELVVRPDVCRQTGDMNAWDCLRLVSDLVAVAGDHSCSPDELAALVSESNRDPRHWLWNVRRVGIEGDATLNGDSSENRRRRKAIDLSTDGVAASARTVYRDDRTSIDDPEDRGFYRRRINLGFQAVDPKYESRAAVDGGHFQLAREPGRIDLVAYLRQALDARSETNATALYATYHALALRRATTGDRRSALMAEAFALHFLEDSFSSGHIVGQHGVDTWLLLKSEGVRMGTHDHYSDAGVEVARWTDLGAPYVAHGDGMMKPIDLGYAATAASASLRELLTAMRDPTFAREHAARYAALPSSLGGGFNACTEAHPMHGLSALAVDDGPLNDVVALEPVPSARIPEPPRYRAEAGLFFGVSAALDGGGATGDGGVGRARAGLRGGVGLNGLTIDPMNSLAFADVAIVALGTQLGSSNGNADAGVSFRIRSPGLVTLVDGIFVLGLLGAGIRAPWLIDLGSRAGSGGVLPALWQSHHLGGVWNLQVSAFRDASFNLYFRSEGRYRWEFQAPVATIRAANPISGLSWAQSNDFWLDVGFSAGRSTEVTQGSFGFYLALSASARSFP